MAALAFQCGYWEGFQAEGKEPVGRNRLKNYGGEGSDGSRSYCREEGLASLWTREGHREIGKIGQIDIHEILSGKKAP